MKTKVLATARRFFEVHSRLFGILLLLSVGLSCLARADDILWIDDSSGRLGTVDVQSGEVRIIGRMPVVLTDIAFDPIGRLYGISFDSIYRVDPKRAKLTHIGDHGIPQGNALVISENGTAYAAGAGSTHLYRINLSTGAATDLGSIGHASAGDLAFNDGKLYLSSNTGELILVNLSPVSGTVLGPIGFSDVFGLATGHSNVLYGSAGTDLFSVNTTTGAGTLALDYQGLGLDAAFGAAFFDEAVPKIQLLDQNDNSPIPEGGVAWITGDSPPKMPALNAQFNTSALLGNARWRLEIKDVRDIVKPQLYPSPLNRAIKWTRYVVAGSMKYSKALGSTIPLAGAFQPVFPNVKFSGTQQPGFYGGEAIVSARLPNKAVSTRSFQILGKNPGQESILDFVTQSDPELWYAAAIFSQESGLQQFYSADQTVTYTGIEDPTQILSLSFKMGEPVFGRPAGYGLGQYDAVANRVSKLNPMILWNWQSNVQVCLQLMNNKRAAAEKYFKAVKAQAKAQWTEPPTFPGTQLSALDATAICLYNGSAGTLRVSVPGGGLSYAPYRFDLLTGTWLTQDNSNDYILAVWDAIQALNLVPPAQ